MMNLDYLAAKYGQQIGLDAEVEEKTLSTALNILHEQGIYALFLWLYQKPGECKSRESTGSTDPSDSLGLYQKPGERCAIIIGIEKLFKENDIYPIKFKGNEFIWNNNNKKQKTDALDTVRNVFTIDLRTMFIAKDLISLTLTYARHAAKTCSGEEN